MVEAYDVKARKKVQIKDPKVVQLKNGRYAIKGTSSETGITVMRICGSDKAKAKALLQNLNKNAVLFCFLETLANSLSIEFFEKSVSRDSSFSSFYKKITKALPTLFAYGLVIGISNESYLATSEGQNYARRFC